jgi:hypothetical protein
MELSAKRAALLKLAEPDNGLLMLESHLRDMDLYEAAPAADTIKRPGKRASSPNDRYLALTCAVLASTWLDDLAEILEIVRTIV